MSEIKKKQSAEAARLINGIDANDRGGSLQAPYWMEVELEEMKAYMSGDTYVDGVLLPRYGVLSLLLRTTPCFVYGHPALKKLSKTAFTDGLHVFISEELFQNLYDEEVKSNGRQEGIVPLMLHELMHKLFNHTGRLLSFPPALANIATDLSINTRLREGFPDIEWVPTLKEGGLGFREGDREKYLGLSEESIARDLYQEFMAKQKKKQEQQQGQNGQQQKGQGQKGQQQQPGQGGQGGQQPGGKNGQQQPGQGGQQPGQNGQGGQQPGQGGQPQGGQQGNEQGQGGGQGGQEEELSDVFGGDNDNHIVDLADLIKTMEEAGLQGALDKLALPASDDVEKIGQVKEDADMRRVEAVERAAADCARNGGKYPGSHIVDCAADVVRGFTRGKMTWRLLIQEALLGEGMRFRGSMEEPSSLYYSTEVADMLGNEVYLPVELPYKPQSTVLCLIDTSGSVNEVDLRAFLAEIFELKTASNGFSDGASEVVILSADTVLRGEPIEVTDSNCDELMQKGVQVFGRGGTDLANSLHQAMGLDLMKDKNIRSVVYFTDLFDRPPTREALGLNDDVTVVYIAAPSTHSQHVAEFAKAVADYARVAEINEGVEVDLSETSMDMPVNPTQGSKRPGMR